MVESKFEIDDMSIFRKICGSNDKNLKKIEKILGIHIIPRGNTLLIKAEKSKNDIAAELLHLMSDFLHMNNSTYEFDEFDIKYLTDSISAGVKVKPDDIKKLRITISDTGKTVVPKTYNQARYITLIHDNPITFSTGPAGTGKTYLSVVVAVDYLQKGKVDRIILTRPAVEAGESLGFLPGDLKQKINPYLRPLYDGLFDVLSFEKVNKLMEKEIIEIAPIAYMRGRTLSNAFIIMDEAQNTSRTQMKMFLTRLGNNSKMVVTGDITQIDLDKPRESGLLHAIKILKNVREIGFITFMKSDISRHPIVEKIVGAYESKHDPEN